MRLIGNGGGSFLIVSVFPLKSGCCHLFRDLLEIVQMKDEKPNQTKGSCLRKQEMIVRLLRGPEGVIGQWMAENRF